ncbi:hypothetical protein [Streptomyces sp. Tu6071]|uniref:hypothetical protein n=1 Tax=Streptomyces sp. Tu6071 TaxID=355249 RepID=UPI00131A1E43|nr:hypothetical protein [Streptomyces sp. Tu6071]
MDILPEGIVNMLIIGILSLGFYWMAMRWLINTIDKRRPWLRGKSLIPVRPAMSRDDAIRMGRQCAALARFHGRPFEASVHQLAAAWAYSAWMLKALGRTIDIVRYILLLTPAIPYIAFILTETDLLNNTFLAAYSDEYFSATMGVAMGTQLIGRKFSKALKKWENEDANEIAIAYCFVMMRIYRYATIVGSIDFDVAKSKNICENLKDFAKDGRPFEEPDLRRAVTQHVSQVTVKIESDTRKLFHSGVAQIPEAARNVSHVLDRVIQHRWLALLEVESEQIDSDDVSESVSNRRDIWIGVGSILGVAAALTLALALKTPLDTLTPILLVLFLAPTALWGGRALREPAGQLLGSVTGGAGRDGAADAGASTSSETRSG